MSAVAPHELDITFTQRIEPMGIPKEVTEGLKAFMDQLVRTNGFNTQTVIYMVTQLMQHVSRFKKLSGADKKNVVIYVINDTIDTTEELVGDAAIIKLMVPPAIDMLVAASKGRYKFKAKIRSCFSCC